MIVLMTFSEEYLPQENGLVHGVPNLQKTCSIIIVVLTSMDRTNSVMLLKELNYRRKPNNLALSLLR